MVEFVLVPISICLFSRVVLLLVSLVGEVSEEQRKHTRSTDTFLTRAVVVFVGGGGVCNYTCILSLVSLLWS